MNTLIRSYSKVSLLVLFYFIIFCLSLNSVFSQASAYSSWVLTSNATSSISGSVTSATATKTGVTASATEFAAAGWSTYNWSTSASRDVTKYQEFQISPSTSDGFYFNTFEFTADLNDGNAASKADVYYSLNSFTSSTQIGSQQTIGTSPTSITMTVGNAFVPQGSTLSIRIYFYGAASGTYVASGYPVVLSAVRIAGNVSSCGGYSTILAESFENAVGANFTVSGGAYYSGNTTVTQVPASSPKAVAGTYSYGMSNGTATITTASINTKSYNQIAMSFRLLAVGSSSANGLDYSDNVKIEISPDGGTTYYTTLTVTGASANEAYWSYSGGTGVATAIYDADVNAITASPGGTGSRTTDGYSTLNVYGLPSVSNLKVKITLLNNSTTEFWMIDDFGLIGCNWCSTYSGTITVGPSGTFTNLTDAVDKLSTCGYTGDITLQLQSTYVSTGETFPIDFSPTGNFVPISGKSVTIVPANGATNLLITSSNATGTIKLNGTDYVYFDGRPQGSSGIANTNLSIINSHASTGYAVYFTGDATYNKLEYCNIKSNITTTTSGVIVFDTPSSSTGNQYNQINFCQVTKESTTPTNCIYSVGLASKLSGYNTINGCYFSDYFNASNAHSAIYIGNYNTNWTITNNRFFQSAARDITAAGAYHRIISFDYSAGSGSDNNTITGNVLGGSASDNSGAYDFTGQSAATAGNISAIYLNVGTGTASTVSNNTIKNFTLTGIYTTATAGYEGAFNGIAIMGGNVTVGSSGNGNIIGANSSTNSITYNTVSANVPVYGIFNTSPNTVTIRYNDIRGIGTKSQSITVAAELYGIYSEDVGNNTISYNTIDSLRCGGASVTSAAHLLYGVYNAGTGILSITNNTISNCDVYSTGSALLYGIYNTGSASTTSISSNNISTLKQAKTGTDATATVNGICNKAAPAITISSNTINSISLSNGFFIGIYDNVAASGTHTISSNTIGGSSNTITISSVMTTANAGIQIGNTGNYTLTSNTIQYIYASGTGAVKIYGIYNVSTGALTITSNIITYLSTTNVSPAIAVQVAGVYNASSGNIDISSSTISYLKTSATDNYASTVYGMYWGGAPNGSILKNVITNLEVNNIGATNPTLSGLHFVTAGGGISIINNYIYMNNNGVTASSPKIYGVYALNTFVLSMYYNTIKLDGSHANSNAPKSGCVYFANADNTIVAAKNNIFQNNISVGTNYVYFAGTTTHSSGTVDYNYYRVAIAKATVGYASLNGTSYTAVTANNASYLGTKSVYVATDQGTDISIGALGALSYSDALIVGFGTDLSNSTTYPNCQDDINGTAGVRASEGGIKGCNEYTTCGAGYTGPLTWSIGSEGGANFPTITAALWALKRCGFTGVITMELLTSYDATYSSTNESYPLLIDNNIGASSSKYIIIRPDAGVTTAAISGSITANPLININNAKYIQIDGQCDGTGGTSNLTITNTATAAASNRAIVIQGATANATNNTIKYCSIKADNSSTTNTTAGVVFLGSSASGNNTSNIFSNNTITYASSANACGLVSYNSTGTNSSNTFSTNNVADFSERGIWLSNNSDQWTISDNNVYRAAGVTGGTTVGLIYIEAGDQYTINGNYLGGNSAYCGAGAGTYFSTSGMFYGLYMSGSGTSTSSIYGNYIKYLASSANTTVYGVYISQNSMNVDMYENDISNIYISNSATGSSNIVHGCYFTGTSFNLNFYKNKVTSIYSAVVGGSSTYYYGCSFFQTTTSTVSCYNNYIDCGVSTCTSRTYGVRTSASTAFILNNTIYIKTTSGQNFDNYNIYAVTASTTTNIYNNILLNEATGSSAAKWAALIYKSTNTINHDNNYYDIPGGNSTCATDGSTNTAFSNWEGAIAVLNGQSGTTMTLYSNGVVNVNTAGVSGLGKNLYSASAAGVGSPAIIIDIVGKARPNGAMWIGCYEGTGNVYYSTTSVASTDASDISKWKTGRDNTGSSPSNFITSGDIFIIQSGHKYQVTNTASFAGSATGYVQVENGGALDINAKSMNSWQYLKLAGTGVSSSGAFINSSTTAASISVPVVLTADATITSSGTGGLTITGGVTGTGYALTISGSNATTISTSGINTSTSGSLVKSGSGTLTISASGDYTGSTTISAGVVNIQNATALGTSAAGTTVASGAALQLQGAAVVSETLTLNGTGVSTDGALRFISGTNSWSGAITLGAASRINSDAGTNTITGGFSGTGYALTLGGAGNGTISTTGINTSTSGTLTKDGAGTWSITASGTYTGLTTVTAGVLDVQNATALGTTAAGTTVASGAALQLQGGITVGAEALTLNNDGVGSAGSLRNVSGANTWGGNITLSTNAVRINSDASTLTLSGTITNAAINLTLGGAGDITANGVIGNGAGTLTKDGAGTLTLGATHTFTGAMAVSAGTVTLAANQSLSSTLTVSAGTLVVSTYTIAVAGATSIGGTLTISTGTFDANGTFTASGGNVTFSGAGFLYLGSTVTSLGTFTRGTASGSTVSYDAAGAQNVRPVNYYNLTLSGSGIKTLQGNIDISGSNGEGLLTVDSGVTFAIGDYTVTHTALDDLGSENNTIAGTVTLNNGIWTPTYGQFANLTTSGSITVTGTGTIYLKGGRGHTLGTFTPGSGTVYYSRNGIMTVSANTFNHLIIDGTSGLKTMAGAVTVNGDFTTTANGGGLIDQSTYTLTCKGNFVNNGTFTASTGTVVFTGTAAQTISGTSDPNFYNFTMNNTAGASITLNTTVSHTFTFTNGKFSIQGFTLTLGTSSANATIAGTPSASNYFIAYKNGLVATGSLKQFINSKSSVANANVYVYPIGDLTNYTPFTMTVNAASTLAAGAYFTMYTNASTISGLSSSVTTYLTRYWSGTDSGITTPDYDISYAYSTGDVIAIVGTEANLRPIKKSGTTWYKPTGSAFTTGTAVGTGGFTVGTRTLTWTGLTSFSDYGAVGPAAVGLPIELIAFEGKKVGGNNELIWRTQTEINNDYFTIEKTTDGDVFEIVGTQNGAGNSNSVLNYNLIDQNVQKVINYYRLIQTDTDGKNTISNLISIDNREIENSEKVVSSITNILGQEINDTYRGMIIITYTDGSSIKTIR